ncbi:phage integrase N-terminal SAM-like domain-containing protein [Rhodocaloribacter sp.]
MDDIQRQPERRVAPFNPHPRWPAGYFRVLREQGVPERNAPLYAHWVRRFFQRRQGNRRRRDLGRADIEAFLHELSDDTAVAAWQVNQAREALEVYYEQFRGIAPAPREARPTPPESTAPQSDKRTAAARRSMPSSSCTDTY